MQEIIETASSNRCIWLRWAEHWLPWEFDDARVIEFWFSRLWFRALSDRWSLKWTHQVTPIQSTSCCVDPMHHMHSWLSFVIVYFDFLFTDQRTRFRHQNYESMRKILSRRFTYQIQTLTLNTSAFWPSDAHKTHSVTASAVSEQCSFLMLKSHFIKSSDDDFPYLSATVISTSPIRLFESVRDFTH